MCMALCSVFFGCYNVYGIMQCIFGGLQCVWHYAVYFFLGGGATMCMALCSVFLGATMCMALCSVFILDYNVQDTMQCILFGLENA